MQKKSFASIQIFKKTWRGKIDKKCSQAKIQQQDVDNSLKGNEDQILEKLISNQINAHPCLISEKALVYNQNWRLYPKQGEYIKVISKQVFWVEKISQLGLELTRLLNNSRQGGALFVGLSAQFKVEGIQLTQNMKSWVRTKLNFVRQNYIYPPPQGRKQHLDFVVEFVYVRQLKTNNQPENFVIKISANTGGNKNKFFTVQRISIQIGHYRQRYQTDVEIDRSYQQIQKCSKNKSKEIKNMVKPSTGNQSDYPCQQSLTKPNYQQEYYLPSNQKIGISIFGPQTAQKLQKTEIYRTPLFQKTKKISYRNKYKDLERQLKLIYLLAYGESQISFDAKKKGSNKIFTVKVSCAQRSILAVKYLMIKGCKPQYQRDQ